MLLLTPAWKAAGAGAGLCLSLGATAQQHLQIKPLNLCLALNVTMTSPPTLRLRVDLCLPGARQPPSPLLRTVVTCREPRTPLAA